MKYSAGDIVRFKPKSGEIQDGEVLFIEKSCRGNMIYINGFNRRMYKVPEKRVIQGLEKKNFCLIALKQIRS